jgi:hypothetical protein
MSNYPMNPENLEKIRTVGEQMLGTCGSLDTVVQEVFADEILTFTELDVALLEELDDITQECADCGWWCETGELDDDQVCNDCRVED